MRPFQSPRRLVAVLGAIVVAGVATAAGSPVASAATNGPALSRPGPVLHAPAPLIIPALPNWTASSGPAMTLTPNTRIDVDAYAVGSVSTAQVLARELHAERGLSPQVRTTLSATRAGDIVIRRDSGRPSLGREGYALSITDRVTITAFTNTGAFYGAQTVAQLAHNTATLPAGSTLDIPAYAERAIGVCAQVYYSDPWLERLIVDMGYLKLNTLHLELKVQSTTDTAINTRPYYTRAEVARLVEFGVQYHVHVIPEMNAPAHASPFIAAYPQLQLANSAGVRNPNLLDITNPAAISFYGGLLKANASLFSNSYGWHLGADEYVTPAQYASYPKLVAYAHAKYGATATPETAYVAFINQIDSVARAAGRTLHIWNDGLTGGSLVPLNSDIEVEYWSWEAVSPQQLMAQGHPVLNAAASLYYIRGGAHPDMQSLWDQDWTPHDFMGYSVGSVGSALTGAELNVWPDNYQAESDSATEQGLFMPLRFMAQVTWGSPRPNGSYASFVTLAQRQGRAPGWSSSGA